MLKKTLIYLGLGPDEEYDSFDDYRPEPGPATTPLRPTVRAVADPEPAVVAPATVRPIASSRPEQSGSVRVITAADTGSPAPEPAPVPAATAEVGGSAVRIVEGPAPATPHVIAPSSFNEAQSIGDRFKASQPVIVNLQGADRDLRRRLVDFASGLCYALGGKMERAANEVYLLTPADVEVTARDRQGFS